MDKKTYDAKLAYNNQYNKSNYKAYTFRLNKVSDADLIACLDNLDTVSFIRSVLKDFIQKHELAQNLKSRRSKKLGMPYEVYALDPEGIRTLVGKCRDLDTAKDLRDASGSDCIIVKRYMNKYGTIVAMRVTA